MKANAQTKTALLPAGEYTGLVTNVNRGCETATGIQDVLELAVPGFSGYDIVIFDQHDEPSPFLVGVGTKSVISFKTKHRTKVDPNTGKEETKAYHSPLPNESDLIALIEAATK